MHIGPGRYYTIRMFAHFMSNPNKNSIFAVYSLSYVCNCTIIFIIIFNLSVTRLDVRKQVEPLYTMTSKSCCLVTISNFNSWRQFLFSVFKTIYEWPIYNVCMIYEQCLYDSCTIYVRPMYNVFMTYAQCMHDHCTMHLWLMNNVCMTHVQYIYDPCKCILDLCTMWAWYLYNVCVLYCCVHYCEIHIKYLWKRKIRLYDLIWFDHIIFDYLRGDINDLSSYFYSGKTLLFVVYFSM